MAANFICLCLAMLVHTTDHVFSCLRPLPALCDPHFRSVVVLQDLSGSVNKVTLAIRNTTQTHNSSSVVVRNPDLHGFELVPEEVMDLKTDHLEMPFSGGSNAFCVFLVM